MIALGVHTAVLLILAAAAWGVTHRLRRPELGHVLWLLVFLKLLIPPVVDVPIFPAAAERGVNPVAMNAPVMTDPMTLALDGPVEHAALDVATANDFATRPVLPAVQAAPAIDPRLTLLLVWLIGVAVCVLVNTIRVARCGSLLGHAEPASAELVQRVQTLARRIGLTETPPVFVLDAAISPAIWTGRRCRLVMPRRLLARLDDREMDSVILHELAHWARGDHWVRALECVVMTLYWWLPPVWWMRRELRDTEELCCDARVVHALSGEPRPYADALIKTVTFLSGPGTRSLPRTATGAGPIRPLTRRLTMIMQTRPAPPWTRRSRIALVLAGLVTLPLMPTRAQDAPTLPQPVDAVNPLLAAPVADTLPRVATTADHDQRIARVLHAMTAAVEARQEAQHLGDLALAGEFGAVLHSLKAELDALFAHGGRGTASAPRSGFGLSGSGGGLDDGPANPLPGRRRSGRGMGAGGGVGGPGAGGAMGRRGGPGGGLGGGMGGRGAAVPLPPVRDDVLAAPPSRTGGGVGRGGGRGAPRAGGTLPGPVPPVRDDFAGAPPSGAGGAGSGGVPGMGGRGGAERYRYDSEATIAALQAQVAALAEQTAQLQRQLVELMRQQQEQQRDSRGSGGGGN